MNPKTKSVNYHSAPGGSADVIAAKKTGLPGPSEPITDDDDVWIAKARADRAAGMATDDEVSDLIRRITSE